MAATFAAATSLHDFSSHSRPSPAPAPPPGLVVETSLGEGREPPNTRAFMVNNYLCAKLLGNNASLVKKIETSLNVQVRVQKTEHPSPVPALPRRLLLSGTSQADLDAALGLLRELARAPAVAHASPNASPSHAPTQAARTTITTIAAPPLPSPAPTQTPTVSPPVAEGKMTPPQIVFISKDPELGAMVYMVSHMFCGKLFGNRGQIVTDLERTYEVKIQKSRDETLLPDPNLPRRMTVVGKEAKIELAVKAMRVHEGLFTNQALLTLATPKLVPSSSVPEWPCGWCGGYNEISAQVCEFCEQARSRTPVNIVYNAALHESVPPNDNQIVELSRSASTPVLRIFMVSNTFCGKLFGQGQIANRLQTTYEVKVQKWKQEHPGPLAHLPRRIALSGGNAEAAFQALQDIDGLVAAALEKLPGSTTSSPSLAPETTSAPVIAAVSPTSAKPVPAAATTMMTTLSATKTESSGSSASLLTVSSTDSARSSFVLDSPVPAPTAPHHHAPPTTMAPPAPQRFLGVLGVPELVSYIYQRGGQLEDMRAELLKRAEALSLPGTQPKSSRLPSLRFAQHRCGNCTQNLMDENTTLCTGCERVRYCSASCRSLHYREHQNVCST